MSPKFQRPYSWEKKHVQVFWNDLTTFQREGSFKGGPDKYFLGPIVIRAESKETIYLLDGQQRLATATIFFAVLRDLARELGTRDATDFARDIHVQLIWKEDVGFALELSELDKSYFEETIQTDVPLRKKPTLRSHRLIQKAQQVLTESVKTKIGSLDPHPEPLLNFGSCANS
ncbi:MAG: DUF262 domain-containing protein [Bryobacteraceae bacterium]